MSQAPGFPVGWQSVLTWSENSFESFWSWSVELGGLRRGQGLESGFLGLTYSSIWSWASRCP